MPTDLTGSIAVMFRIVPAIFSMNAALSGIFVNNNLLPLTVHSFIHIFEHHLQN